MKDEQQTQTTDDPSGPGWSFTDRSRSNADFAGGAAVTPYFQQDGVTLYHGDCREILAGLPDESVSAIVNTFQIRRTR